MAAESLRDYDAISDLSVVMAKYPVDEGTPRHRPRLAEILRCSLILTVDRLSIRHHPVLSSRAARDCRDESAPFSLQASSSDCTGDSGRRDLCVSSPSQCSGAIKTSATG